MSLPGLVSPITHLTIAIPMNKFEKMIDNMEESFLTTQSWASKAHYKAQKNNN